jgi:hypothetical protein
MIFDVQDVNWSDILRIIKERIKQGRDIMQKYSFFWLFAFLFTFSSVSYSQSIATGSYNSFFADGTFSIKPPQGFNDFKRDPSGATFFNHEQKISFSIHHTPYPELEQLGNEDVLKRYESNEFKEGFIRGFNSISDRKILEYKLTNIGKMKVLKFTAVDMKNKVNPIIGIIYYRNGIEFKITLGAESLDVLEKNEGLFGEILFLMEN